MEQIQQIKKQLLGLNGIGLQEMESIQLLNRIDSKYVFHLRNLTPVLDAVAPFYRVLDIEGTRVFRYETQYYDTADRMLYHMHHSGRPNRFKIRTRTYVDTGESFFETKYKVKTNRTMKVRKKINGDFGGVSDSLFNLVSWGRWGRRPVEEALRIDFFRVTLASISPPERITLDVQVTFANAHGTVVLDHLVIAEIKQDKSNVFSPFLQELKKYHLEQIGFSKYSTGIALLEPVKRNAFKPNLIKISKLTGQSLL